MVVTSTLTMKKPFILAFFFLSILGFIVNTRMVSGFSDGLMRGVSSYPSRFESGEQVEDDWVITTVDQAGTTGSSSSIALDAESHVHISYVDYGNNHLRYAFQDATGWYTETVDTTSVASEGTSLALDDAGFPHVSYQSGYDLKYAYQSDSGWHFQSVDTVGEPANQNRIRSSLALDSANRPHITYYDPVNGDLKYVRYNGTGWDIEVIEADGDAGFYNSLALDSNDRPHVSFYSLVDTQRIKYGVRDESGWQVQTVDSIGAGPHNAIALDHDDRPHIAYYTYLRDSNLYYAYLGDSGWNVEVADGVGNVGTYPSITIDSSGLAHVSYSSVAQAAVRYAFRESSGEWHTTVVASGFAMEGSALALDEKDKPHISFSNYLSKDLLYAYYDLGDITPPSAISDLVAITGNISREVDLSWTAPGDDGDGGTAASYTVRYATAPIETELAWESATDVEGEPTPQPADSAESMTVSGLTPGETYYFAIRAEDEVGNTSGLSNSPQAVAKEAPDLGFRPDPNGFQFANREIQRSWDMFEQYFGAENVRHLNGDACLAAEQFFREEYRAAANGWSCLGFSQASLLSYLNVSQPNAGPFGIPHYDQLYQQPLSDALTNPIAYYSGIQSSQQWVTEYFAWLHRCDSSSTAMVDTIGHAIENGQPIVLTLNPGLSTWHTVSPYRIENVSPTELHIYVYDSEVPGEERLLVLRHNGNNWAWEYTFVGSVGAAGRKVGACRDMYPLSLQISLDRGIPPVNLCQPPGNELRATTVASTILTSVPATESWVFWNEQGQRFGWVDGAFVAEIPDAYIAPQTLGEAMAESQTVILPNAAYTFESEARVSGATEQTLFADGRFLHFSGNVGSPTSTIQVTTTVGLDGIVLNNLSQFSSISVSVDSEQSDGSRLGVITMSANGESENVFVHFDGQQLQLKPTGGQMLYDLELQHSNGQRFIHHELELLSTDTHFLVPVNWADLDDSEVHLKIDRGSDGTVDETVVLDDQEGSSPLFTYLPMIAGP